MPILGPASFIGKTSNELVMVSGEPIESSSLDGYGSIFWAFNDF